MPLTHHHRFLVILMLWMSTVYCHSAVNHELPWKSGERLTYDIHWGMAYAAQAQFLAEKVNAQWQFKMQLRPRGLVKTLHPFRIDMESSVHPAPWRTIRFHQDRREKPTDENSWGKLKQHTITFAPDNESARFVDPNDGRDIIFEPLTQETLDLVSMLYFIRQHEWENHDNLTVTIANRYKDPDRVAIKLLERVEKAIGSHPKQPLIHIQAEKLAKPGDEEKKKHRIQAQVWATDDELKIPLLARVKMKFGTITVRLNDNALSP